MALSPNIHASHIRFESTLMKPGRTAQPTGASMSARRLERLFSSRGEALEMVRVRDLRPHPLLSRRRYPRGYIESIAKACRLVPGLARVIAEDDNSVVGGLPVYLAAKRLGLKELPVIRTRRLGKRERRATECVLAGRPVELVGPRGGLRG